MAITDAPKIVTRRLEYDDSHTLERYLATGGYEGLRKALSMTPEAVAAEVDAASLLGRGGAGFPAGRKWSMLRKNPVTYLVINGDESEPATFKDHLLIEGDPHQIIEGVMISAYALQVTQAFIYLRGEFALGLERLQTALNEAYAHGAVGRDIFGSGFSLDVVVHPGAGAYICGEETALLESLEGKRGFPRIKPPFFPAVTGLYGEPTVVNNVETMANIPWIITNGGAAFAALGEGRSTGTRLFALAGKVRNPGTYELEMVKTTFRDLIYVPVLGGGISGGNELKAFIPGGVSAPWFGPDQVDLPLGQDEVGSAGSMLGSGSVVVMDSSTCMVRAAWRITKSSRASRVDSARRVVRGRVGSSGSCTELRMAPVARKISIFLWICATTSHLEWPGLRSRRRSASSVRRSHRRSPLGFACSATSSWSTSKMGGAPLTEADGSEAISFTLDGRTVTGNPGEMLIAAAERAGTYIPRFCYHPRMEPVGMCRMCLVEVDGPRGATLQPSCFIAVSEGMAVDTQSDKVKKAQDGVLEFLLANHPLDCPVCDKGGECPLQDQTLAYGPGESRFVEEKRHFEKPIAISDLVLLDRERCIQCARCTRFAAEVAGEAQIDFSGRGELVEVATFPTEPFSSYFSGNTVQICPVGALTATPYRFTARPWDLDQVESTCTTCSVGCRVAVQSSSNRLTRVLGIDSEPVNHGWLCDKGRFAFESVNGDVVDNAPESDAVADEAVDVAPATAGQIVSLGASRGQFLGEVRETGRFEHGRLIEPQVRKNGELVAVSWGEALTAAAAGVISAKDAGGPDAVAVIGGARLTNESAYAWAKLAKGVIGTDSVDAQLGDGLPAELVLGLPLRHDRRGLRRSDSCDLDGRPPRRTPGPVLATARSGRSEHQPHRGVADLDAIDPIGHRCSADSTRRGAAGRSCALRRRRCAPQAGHAPERRGHR